MGDGQGYTLQVDRDAVDRMQFEHLVSEGRRLRPDNPTAAGDTLREALALWHGPPLADLSDAASLQPEITRLVELRLTALEDRIAADLDAKRDRDLVGDLEALTAEHPLRELLWAQLMHGRGGVGDLDISADGRFVAVSNLGDPIRVFDASGAGRATVDATFDPSSEYEVIAVALSADGSRSLPQVSTARCGCGMRRQAHPPPGAAGPRHRLPGCGVRRR